MQKRTDSCFKIHVSEVYLYRACTTDCSLVEISALEAALGETVMPRTSLCCCRLYRLGVSPALNFPCFLQSSTRLLYRFSFIHFLTFWPFDSLVITLSSQHLCILSNRTKLSNHSPSGLPFCTIHLLSHGTRDGRKVTRCFNNLD